MVEYRNIVSGQVVNLGVSDRDRFFETNDLSEWKSFMEVGHGETEMEPKVGIFYTDENGKKVGPDTLSNLGLAEGDVVQFPDCEPDTVKKFNGGLWAGNTNVAESTSRHWTVISRAPTATPALATFVELSDVEQGALLLAKHRGLRIEYHWANAWYSAFNVERLWDSHTAYRIAPTRVKGTVELIDGEPDLSTWKQAE